MRLLNASLDLNLKWSAKNKQWLALIHYRDLIHFKEIVHFPLFRDYDVLQMMK